MIKIEISIETGVSCRFQERKPKSRKVAGIDIPIAVGVSKESEELVDVVST